MRQGNEIVLTTYGRSSGFCVDPVEKKPLNHFLPGTAILSFGTAGCNLACKFCQIWDISKSRETARLSDEAGPEALASACVRLGCKSIAFTYNDPVVFLEYAVDVAKACRDVGVRPVAVTAGYISQPARRELFENMDAANVDLKAFSNDFYRKMCSAELAPVLETLEYIVHESKTWLEITTLLIPGENDSEQEIDKMSRWIIKQLGRDVPLHFSAFHPDYKITNKPRTSKETLHRAREIARANGLHYVYTGNIDDEEGQSTYCSGCGKIVIGRSRYAITAYHLNDNGYCSFCGAKCAGLFSGPAGDWGAKRLPVRF
jgi:pyruvate formate lyase activating enzyme